MIFGGARITFADLTCGSDGDIFGFYAQGHY